MVLFLIACSTPDSHVESFAAGLRADAAARSTLTVDVDADDAESVALVQYTFDGSNLVEYATYAESAVVGDEASFSLNTAPSAAVKANGGGTSCLFAVLLLDDDGAVIGISEDVVGWYATAPDGARTSGWLIGRDQLLADASAWATIASGLDVDDRLAGPESLSITGTAATLSSSTGVRFTAEPVVAEAAALGDWAVSKSWTVEHAGEPDEDSVVHRSHFDVGHYPLEVYVDGNGSRSWDRATEADIGEVCHGSKAVILQWIAPVYGIEGAAALWYADLHSGWTVGTLDGADVTEIHDSTFRIKSAC